MSRIGSIGRPTICWCGCSKKKKFPSELSLKSIEHEMRSNNVDGMKVTQLSHSTLLSYGFTDYNHRARLLTEILKLVAQYPSAQQTPKQQQHGYKQIEQKQDDQKEAVKADG